MPPTSYLPMCSTKDGGTYTLVPSSLLERKNKYI